MKKMVIKLRRNGEMINETRPIIRAKKVRTVKVKSSSWGRISMSEKRASVPCPTRKDLTAVQWQEW